MNRLEFQKVRFKNFLSFGNSWQEVPLLNGINIVLGLDKDTGKSNGAGKSSFLETISFALFGSIHSDVKQADIINWKKGKETEVELFFTKDKHQYKIYRSLKPNLLEIYKDNKLIDPPSHVKYYQEQLEEIVGINKQTFSKLIHSNINSSNSILNMSKPDKRKFMEKVFGLEIYSNLQKVSNEKLKTTEDSIRETSLKIDYNEKSIFDMTKTTRDLNDTISSISSSEPEKLKKLSSKLQEVLKNQIPKFELKKLKEKYDIDKKERDIKEKELNKINATTDIMRKNLKESEKEHNSIELVKLPDVKVIEEKKGLFEKGIDGCEQIDRKLTVKLAVAQSELGILEKQMRKLGDNSICPLCGQEVSGDIHIDNAEKVENIIKFIKKISLELNNNKNKLKDIQTKMKKLLLIEKKCEQANKNKERKDELANKIIKLKKELGRTSSIEKELAKEVVSLNLIVLNEEKKLETEKELNDEYTTLNQELKYLQEKIETENKRKQELEKIISENEKKINKLELNNKKFNKDKEKLNDTKDYLIYIKEVCKDENAKSLAISRTRPVLMKNTNQYLSEIGFNFYINLDNWLNAIIKGPGITNGSYKSLSSGEKKTVDLALQNSFLDIARIQYGILPDILIFDEVLDSSIDGTGLTKIVEIIRKKEIKDSLKIFIISHKDDIMEVEYDNLYKITKESGYSSIEIEKR